jgi:lactoylglutathione lyase
LAKPGKNILYREYEMITNLGHVAFWVKDLDRSLEFYTKVIGLKEAFRLYRDDGSLGGVYLYISPNNFIEIFPSTGDSPAHEQGKTGYSHFCLQVDDAKKSLEELRARGAPIDVELKTGISRCIQFWTHDPDGNRFEFMELPPESRQYQANLEFGKARP